MEGMRDVALAHYEILPDEEKSAIQRDFKQMVTDGNVSEYFKSIFDELRPRFIDEVLETCKENKEGNLDFKDFITVKYILKNQIVLMCNGCSSVIMGRSFFSCYECFCNIGEDSYNICCGCYSSKMFKNHNHREFYDNYKLHTQSRTMFAKMKSDGDKRDTLEQVYISFAYSFLVLAGKVKTPKYAYENFVRNPEEALAEISRRAIEFQKISDAAEKEDDDTFEENDDDKFEESNDDDKFEESSDDDVEISPRIPGRRGGFNLLGAKPTVSIHDPLRAIFKNRKYIR